VGENLAGAGSEQGCGGEPTITACSKGLRVPPLLTEAQTALGWPEERRPQRAANSAPASRRQPLTSALGVVRQVRGRRCRHQGPQPATGSVAKSQARLLALPQRGLLMQATQANGRALPEHGSDRAISARLA